MLSKEDAAKLKKEWSERIDSMTVPDEPKHEWRVGEWAHWKFVTCEAKTFKVEKISGPCLYAGGDDDMAEPPCYQMEYCIPIPTPHEIGTWIYGTYGKGVTMQISKREWNNSKPDWAYYGTEYGHFSWHKDSTPIPAPLFEVGEKVKQDLCKVTGKITRRFWINDCPGDGKQRWLYDIEGHALGFWEESLTRVVHEWKVDEWFRHNTEPVIYQVHETNDDKIFPKWANGSFYKSECHPVYFIQIEGDEIGEGSIVRTKDGWVGSVIWGDSEGKWTVDGHDMCNGGTYIADELTLCSPEGKS